MKFESSFRMRYCTFKPGFALNKPTFPLWCHTWVPTDSNRRYACARRLITLCYMQLATWQPPDHQHLALEAIGYQEADVVLNVKETPTELVYEEVLPNQGAAGAFAKATEQTALPAARTATYINRLSDLRKVCARAG